MILITQIQQPVHVIIDSKDTIIDYLPLILAAIAVLISFIALRRSKKSVEPFISMNGSNMHPEKGHIKSKYSIKNSGLGPAQIQTCDFLYKDKKYHSFDKLLVKEKNEYFSKATDNSQWLYDISDTILSPMEELELFDCTFKVPYPDSLKYSEFLSEVELVIEFRSVYGKKKEYRTFLNRMSS